MATGQKLNGALLTMEEKMVSKLQDNDTEQYWLRYMVQMRPTHSLIQIATALNAAGVTSKQGGTWQCGNVDGVLNSKHTRKFLQTSAPADDDNLEEAA